MQRKPSTERYAHTSQFNSDFHIPSGSPKEPEEQTEIIINARYGD